MSHNCLEFTYKTLLSRGYNLPSSWGNYSVSDFEWISNNASKLLAKKLHIDFFKSFCEATNEAKQDDIILTDTSIGVAINKYKYMTLRARNGQMCLVDINKDDLILRIKR
jgi:hypothetical protein